MGFLSFHKYDATSTWYDDCSQGYPSDYNILRNAGRIDTSENYCWSQYSPIEVQQKWREERGELLPILCTETNLNSAWYNGTDPRIQRTIGAVWYAEELRFFILNGLRFATYYSFASDDSALWGTAKPTQGWGFGMIERNQPHTMWYPYLVNILLGNNMNFGDPIFAVMSNDTDTVSALAWKDGNQSRLLLICKTDEQVNVDIIGLPPAKARADRIDNDDICISSEAIVLGLDDMKMNGYTVLLVSW
jgi:hypothetical protein